VSTSKKTESLRLIDKEGSIGIIWLSIEAPYANYVGERERSCSLKVNVVSLPNVHLKDAVIHPVSMAGAHNIDVGASQITTGSYVQSKKLAEFMEF
jgi:hypothetical protein